ncbi:DNA/RNA nuclease SfsA [Alteromonas sp. CYL-A6]|uniref:DNA/RNA nuclease SfsA n=1 Tax=Alteromonas nitratireducens TaxID=3390813 RepID=UPI0034BB08ED
MQFNTPLIKGTLVKRYKRFFADVETDSGEIITAHCPNTGAMTGCAEPGFTAYLSRSDNPKRKLAYTWELAQTPQGDWIGINTHNANKLVEEALLNNALPGMDDIVSFKREVTPPGGTSRFDFAIEHTTGTEYLEVKSVTLARGTDGVFPDAVTARGAKHCNELAELAQRGIATSLLFCVQHTAIKQVGVAADIDPNYARALHHAMQCGVRVFAVGCEISEQKVNINQALPLNL